jgi:hypothetical protein
MHSVVCRSMTIDARYAASASGSLHRKPTDLFGGELEKFARTETAGYSACSSAEHTPNQETLNYPYLHIDPNAA